jgi:hypothetical protein
MSKRLPLLMVTAWALSSIAEAATSPVTRPYIGPSIDGSVSCFTGSLSADPDPGIGGACFDVPPGARTMSFVIADTFRQAVRFGVDEYDATGKCPDRRTDPYGSTYCVPPIGVRCGTQASFSLNPSTVRVEVVLLRWRNLSTINEPCENGGGWGTTGTITANFSA